MAFWPDYSQKWESVQIVRSNVVLCGGPASTFELAWRWRPVRSSYGLDASFAINRLKFLKEFLPLSGRELLYQEVQEWHTHPVGER